jgi:DNA-binding transcriptional LysR family regulator
VPSDRHWPGLAGGALAVARHGIGCDKHRRQHRIQPLRMVVAASPEYFTRYPVPQHPNDLMAQDCINQRMQSSGGLYVWDFERRGKKMNVRVDGQLIFNTTQPQIDAALAGLGITLLPEDELSSFLEDGRLARVLEDWCPKFDGYHLYYPSRRQPSPAFTLVVQALRGATPHPF